MRGRYCDDEARRVVAPYIVLAKYTPLGTPKGGHSSLRSLARPLPTKPAAQPLAALPPYGCGVPLAGKWVQMGEDEQRNE